MARNENSILLRALDRAAVLAMAEEARREQEEERKRAPVYRGGPGAVRGAPDVRGDGGAGGVAAPQPGGSVADVLLSRLDGAEASIEEQIAQVQSWLRARPDLLRLLDQGIRGEIADMERRTNRKNVTYNVIFTLVGAVLGLVLPYVVGKLSFMSTLFGR